MGNRIHYDQCPVCGSRMIDLVIKAKDHTVSQETFDIAECGQCGLRFTQDVPDASAIIPYYKSEDYISHSNTSQGLVNSLYKAVRKTTMKSKRKLVERETGIRNGVLLDVGSGVGSYVKIMQDAGWQVTGLEPDGDARTVAHNTYNLQLSGMEMFYQLPENTFDAITLWHVLEHVHDLSSYVTQLKKILKPSGKLFIAVPNYPSKDAKIYGGHWAAYDVPRHLYHFSPNAMRVLMDNHGLTVQKYLPMWFDSFYISLLSSKYKNGRSNLAGAFLNGLRSNLSAMADRKKCSSVIYIAGK